jgi:hypothetical protein
MVAAAPLRKNSPTPMKTIAGMSFHDALKLTKAMMPQTIQATPMAASITGFEGRRPTCPVLAASAAARGPLAGAGFGGGVVPFGVIRPPFFLAMAEQ